MSLPVEGQVWTQAKERKHVCGRDISQLCDRETKEYLSREPSTTQPRANLIMHVYTAKVQTGTSSTIPPAFQQRGIERLTSGPVGATTVMGYATHRVPIYEVYKGNIDAFVAATSRQADLPIGPLPGFSIRDSYLPIPLPKIVFALSRQFKFPKNELEMKKKEQELIKKFEGADPKIEQSGQAKKITLNKASWKSLKGIQEKFSERMPIAARGELNIFHHASYRHLHAVASEFLATNTYPCFSSEDSSAMEVDVEEDPRFWKGDVEIPYDLVVDGADVVRSLPEHPNAKALEDCSLEDWLPTNVLTIKEQKFAVQLDQLRTTAKKSPIPLKFNFGPPAKVPNMPGISFPYFKGLLLSDPTSLFNLFIKHFRGTLGSTTAQLEATVAVLRADLDKGSTTDFHLVLTHIYFMIDLALQTQTRLFVVITDTYVGSVLLGARFKIFTGLAWVGPEASELLQASVAELASHEEAVAMLLDIINKYKKTSVPRVSENDAELALTSSWTMAELLKKKDLLKKMTDVDQKRFERALGLIQYGGAYKDINYDNVLWAMKELNLQDPLTKPFHVFFPDDPATLWDVVNTKRGRVLASFGPNTFSFMSTKGDSYLLSGPLEKADSDGRLYAIGGGPTELFVFRKPLSVVIAELDKLRDGTKDSRIVVGSRAKEKAVMQRKAALFTTVETVSVWNELVTYHFPKQLDVAEVDKGTKRPNPYAEEDLPKGTKNAFDDLDDFVMEE